MATTANLPTQTSTALKEWATVLEAMGRGEQIVLIRKGGLIEPGSGFELTAENFVFYPTFEHQAVNYLRPQFQRYFEDAAKRRAPEGSVRFELAGVPAASWRSSDPGIIERLEDSHIYNGEFTTQRLKWQPDMPLLIAAVRVWRLPQAQTVATTPQYAGCKSWVQLDQPVPLAAAAPVLDDITFGQRLHDLAGRITPLL